MRFLRNRQLWKQLFLGLLIVALWVSLKQLPIREHAVEFAAWVRQQGFVGLGAFWLVYICATLLFLPVSVLSLSAGAIFGPAKGLALTMASAITGASAAFLIARHVARSYVEKRAAGNERFVSLQSVIGERDWKIVLLLRLSILIPFHVSNYALGITRVGFLPYLIASAIGMAPGTFVYVYLGHLGQTTVVEEGTLHPMQIAIVSCGLVATTLVTIYLARIANARLRRKVDLKAPAPACPPANASDPTNEKGDPS